LNILPRSIVGRTAWVLTVGFVVVVAGSVLVSSIIIRSESHAGNVFEIVTKVIALTSIMKNMDVKNRAAVINSLNDDNINVLRGQDLIEQAEIINNWGIKRIQHHLHGHMDALGLQDVSVTHPLVGNSPDKTKIIVSVLYMDGDKVQFLVKSPHRHIQMVINILLVSVFIISCIYILSLVVTRQIVKPINQFSIASSRFSTDIYAPALEEYGPIEIKQAAIAFNTMQDRIRRFVNERMQMIAAISHDLRTPLTRLRLRVESIDDETLKEKTLRDIAEMQSMLDSTLSFARDDASTEAKTIVDMAALIKSICDDETDSGNLSEYEGPEHFNYHCRPTAMRRALNNILGNAIKYAGAAQVTLVKKENEVTIEVLDSGPGIPDAQLESVFEPFYRVEASRNSETGGTGLGLTVARTIIRAHGGDI